MVASGGSGCMDYGFSAFDSIENPVRFIFLLPEKPTSL